MVAQREKAMLPMRGREQELQQLLDAWEAVLDGQVRYVRISGEPGTGRTRLVQAFYEKLTKVYDPPSPEHPQGYWPDLLEVGQAAENIHPAFPHSGAKLPPMPFFWWVINCSLGEMLSGKGLVPYFLGMEQIYRHLTYVEARRIRVAALEEAGVVGAALGLQAIPWVGPYLASSLGMLTGFLHLSRKLREAGDLKHMKASDVAALEEASRKLEDFVVHLIGSCSGHSSAGGQITPTVLIIQDAHWLDGRSFALTRRLLGKGAEESWKLMVIATVSRSVLEQQAELDEGAPGRPEASALELEYTMKRTYGSASVVTIDLH